jgi:hypothetical protein
VKRHIYNPSPSIKIPLIIAKSKRVIDCIPYLKMKKLLDFDQEGAGRERPATVYLAWWSFWTIKWNKKTFGVSAHHKSVATFA